MKWLTEAKLLALAWIALAVGFAIAFWLFLQLLYYTVRWVVASH